VMSWDEWRNMGEMMGGVDVMGGPATGLVAGVHASITPPPDMERMGHGAMRNKQGAMRHEGGAKPDTVARHKMGAMHDSMQTEKPGMATDSAHMRRMMDLHMQMMADPIIRRRVMEDTAMRRLMQEVMAEMPAEHQKHMRPMMRDDPKKPAQPRVPAPRPREPEPKDSAAHRGHEVPDRPQP